MKDQIEIFLGNIETSAARVKGAADCLRAILEANGTIDDYGDALEMIRQVLAAQVDVLCSSVDCISDELNAEE